VLDFRNAIQQERFRRIMKLKTRCPPSKLVSAEILIDKTKVPIMTIEKVTNLA